MTSRLIQNICILLQPVNVAQDLPEGDEGTIWPSKEHAVLIILVLTKLSSIHTLFFPSAQHQTSGFCHSVVNAIPL